MYTFLCWEVSDIMMKMLVEMDEDKICREGRYDMDKINLFIGSALQGDAPGLPELLWIRT